jgi:hypothetical protein
MRLGRLKWYRQCGSIVVLHSAEFKSEAVWGGEQGTGVAISEVLGLRVQDARLKAAVSEIIPRGGGKERRPDCHGASPSYSPKIA